MKIDYSDLGNIDEGLARRILVRARLVAPTLDQLEGDDRENAIAILAAAAAEVPAPGERRIKSLGRNGTRVDFEAGGGLLSIEDIEALRGLCGIGATSAGPQGSFPDPGAVTSVWPEKRR